MRACPGCLRRSWLLARLAAHLDRSPARGVAIADLLGRDDEELIAQLAGARAAEIARERRAFDADGAAAAASAAELAGVCEHGGLPRRLADTGLRVGALHVAGGLDRWRVLTDAPSVAIVGSRSPSEYGIGRAGDLARGLARSGVTVVSGMAMGIDAAAHEGALEAGGRTIAVLASGADVPYPRRERALHARIVAAGCVVSELPPGTPAHRWAFPARNRIIAALADATVVVEARQRSGSLITAAIARELGRDVAAVPGRVDSELASGPLSLIFDGASLVRDVADVLDLVLGVGAGAGARTGDPARPALEPRLATILSGLARWEGSATGLAGETGDAAGVLAAATELERLGCVRRCGPGHYEVIA